MIPPPHASDGPDPRALPATSDVRAAPPHPNDPGPAAPSAGALALDQRRFLLGLARQALHELVRGGRLPQPDPAHLEPWLLKPAACFVTLTKAGQLRGCIGHLVARRPLYETILENTRNAALADPRFPAVQADELAQITLELSVLTNLQPLPYTTTEDLLAKLRPHVDGVVLHLAERMTTFLPQVWEQLPDKLEFLDRLAQKAGGPPQAWRQPGTRISVYQVEAFSEPAAPFA